MGKRGGQSRPRQPRDAVCRAAARRAAPGACPESIARGGARRPPSRRPRRSACRPRGRAARISTGSPGVPASTDDRRGGAARRQLRGGRERSGRRGNDTGGGGATDDRRHGCPAERYGFREAGDFPASRAGPTPAPIGPGGARLSLAARELENGSPGRARTADPMINSHLLYQLSYRGTARRSVVGTTRPVNGPVDGEPCKRRARRHLGPILARCHGHTPTPCRTPSN